MTTPHRLVNPETMTPATGFAHAVVPTQGQAVYLAGQTASNPAGVVVGRTFCEQYEVALNNVVEALKHAGGQSTDIVSLVVYTTDMQAYRGDRARVGAAHRKHLGRHYPAMALLGVTELYDPDALVEIVATAVIPNHNNPDHGVSDPSEGSATKPPFTPRAKHAKPTASTASTAIEHGTTTVADSSRRQNSL